MNTSDVRNMDLSQWVYWVTAIPFTGALIFIIAWSTDELNLFKPDFKKLLGGKRDAEEKPVGKWRSVRRRRRPHGISTYRSRSSTEFSESLSRMHEEPLHHWTR
jgi:hypothetical protein